MTIGQKLLMKFLEVALCICLIVFACDIIPMFLSWLKRIHIGQFLNENEWRTAAEKRARKQIKKMPHIQTTDRTAYTIFPLLKGAYRNRRFICWQEACLLLGMEGDQQSLADAKKFFDKAEVANSEYTIGNAMLIYALMKNGFEKDKTVRAAADAYAQKMLKFAGENTLPYLPSGINRFVDTLGMACPFLMLYDKLYTCPEAKALAIRQLDEYYKFGIHSVTGLPVHCFNSKTKAPLGIYGWGRGCGWLAIALAECHSILGNEDEYSVVLEQRTKKIAAILTAYQKADGSFSSQLGTSSRADSSATAILGWFLARAAKICGNEAFAAASKKCVKYIISVTRQNGEVDFAQGDTIGVGNYSRRFEPLPAALGFALRIGK